MIKLLADENFHGDIFRGLLRRRPNLDLVRVQDVGLYGMADPIILDWAAQENRVLLSHDVRTITKYAYDRVRDGLPMPGVFEVSRSTTVRRAIEDLLLVVDCGLEGEFEGQVRYIPL